MGLAWLALYCFIAFNAVRFFLKWDKASDGGQRRTSFTWQAKPSDCTKPSYIEAHRRLALLLSEYTEGALRDYNGEMLQIKCRSTYYTVTCTPGDLPKQRVNGRLLRDEYFVPYRQNDPIKARSYYYDNEWWHRMVGLLLVPETVLEYLQREVFALHGSSSDEVSKFLKDN